MTHRVSRMRVLVRRGRRVNLLLAWGRSKGLPIHEDFRDRATTIKAAAIKAKAKAGLLARQG